MNLFLPSSLTSKTTLQLITKGVLNRNTLPVKALIAMQSLYYAYYSLSSGVKQLNLQKYFTYSPFNRRGMLLSAIGHKDIQSYLASMAILGTVGRYHAMKFGPVSFVILIASGSICGAAMTETAYQLRGKDEGWTFKSSGLSGTGALLLYNCMFNRAKIYRIHPQLLLFLALFYGFYYSDCNVAGATVGTMVGASLLGLM